MKWVKHEGHTRYQVVRFLLGNQEFVLLGIYFPALNIKNLVRRRQQAAIIDSFIRHAHEGGDRCILLGGDINEVPPWHAPKIFDYTVEGFPIHTLVENAGLIDLADEFLPENSFSWFDCEGNGQLLDGMFISARYKHWIERYSLLSDVFDMGLSDHLGLAVRLSFKRAQY